MTEINGRTSDGYHTFDELYEFRMLYNALLFNEWARRGVYGVHKSWHHHDGQPCFNGNWFIVVAQLPGGQISQHYPAKDWGKFRVAERPCAAAWDGHTPRDVLDRLADVVRDDEWMTSDPSWMPRCEERAAVSWLNEPRPPAREVPGLEGVTRFVLIDAAEVYESRGVDVRAQLQDDGRTLKVWITRELSTR